MSNMRGSARRMVPAHPLRFKSAFGVRGTRELATGDDSPSTPARGLLTLGFLRLLRRLLRADRGRPGADRAGVRGTPGRGPARRVRGGPPPVKGAGRAARSGRGGTSVRLWAAIARSGWV